MANVLLLRSPTQDAPDKYEDALRSFGYHPLSVPVLETVLKNIDVLKTTLTSGHAARGYAGVIVTSGRACEAWQTAALELQAHEGYPDGADWPAVPFYVVGEATAKALAATRGAIGKRSPFAPRDIRGGAESGTSERLAHFIVRDLSKAETESRRLLYLTGDKNRDTLPKILGDAGFELDALQVYATQGSSTFAADLKRTMDGVEPGASQKWWTVYFAPSAAAFVTPLLREHFDLGSDVASGARTISKIAAIGPTTSTFLRETLELRVDVTAPRPTPDSLVSAILVSDNNF